MTEFQIHLINSDEATQSELNSVLEQITKKLFPDFRPLLFPAWLLEDQVDLYEKEGVVLIVKLLSPSAQLEDVFSLAQLKLKVEKSISVFSKHHQVIVAVLGQKISLTLQKLIFMEENFRVFEIISVNNTREIFVRELTDYHHQGFSVRSEAKKIESKEKHKSEVASNVAVDAVSSEPHLRQDVSMSSFFYKMGKLSEEELTRFLELELELAQIDFK